MRVRAQAQIWWGGVAILVKDGRSRGVITMQDVPDGMESEPTLNLEWEEAQILMDDLWNSGVRPTEGAGSAGAMLATQNHLKDIRLIAGAALGKLGIEAQLPPKLGTP